MQRLTVPVLAFLVSLTMVGCIKSSNTAAINGDNTGSMTMKVGVKTEAIEQIKAMAENMGGMGGDEGGDQVDEAFKEIDALMDEAKLREKLEKGGFKLAKVSSSEKEGWKTLEVEASIPDVNLAIEKAVKDTDKKTEGTPLHGMQLPGGNGMIMLPSFYKTETEGVGQAVLVPAIAEMFESMGENPLEQLEDMDDEMRDMVEAQIENMKSMFSVDEMSIEMTIKLPGDIVAVKGCKKVDDRTVTFAMKGGDITMDSMKNMMGLKDGVSVTFKIPEDCKLKFQDAPKKAEKKAEPAEGQEGEEKKEKKKGGLKIGEGEGKK